MKYILVTEDSKVMVFSVFECAVLYRSIKGGFITTMHEGVTTRLD